MEEQINILFMQIEQYASEKNYLMVKKALYFIKEAMSKKARNLAVQNRYQSDLYHALQVCDILMDLHPAISNNEEECLLSAALLHIYPENFIIEDLEDKLVRENGFSKEISNLVNLVVPVKDPTDEEQKEFYKKAQENRLSLLVVLADRGNVVQQLYRLSTWNAHRYIDETKACYYPMCIYGKEHYHTLLAPISVLLEKMRTLIEVSEVLLTRYEQREAELIQDILALREENATIKGIISKFRGEA